MINPLLSLQDISYSYHDLSGETLALSHISFDVSEGEFIAIVGPSGCGKSTLLSMISGLLKPEEGSITIHGKSISAARANIGYMLQKDHLFEWRTILGNVLLGLEIQHRLTKEAKERVVHMLDLYGLGAFTDARPSQLSGGMRQRAALIRTLALEPDLLLLDEPFSALDYQTRLQVGDDIGTIIRNEGKTAILVTHDLSEAISMADRVLVMSSRPGTLVREVPIDFFSLEKDTPLLRRNTESFKDYFNLIWKELNHHGPFSPSLSGSAEISAGTPEAQPDGEAL